MHGNYFRFLETIILNDLRWEDIVLLSRRPTDDSLRRLNKLDLRMDVVVHCYWAVRESARHGWWADSGLVKWTNLVSGVSPKSQHGEQPESSQKVETHDLALDWSIHYQMDFILILRRFKSSIHKAQINKYTDKDINSDRSLILPSLRVKLGVMRHTPTPQFALTWTNRKTPVVPSLVICDEVTHSGHIKQVLLSLVHKILGGLKAKKQFWFTKEVNLYDRRGPWGSCCNQEGQSLDTESGEASQGNLDREQMP